MTLLSSSADSTSSPTQKPLETNGIEYSISEGSRLFQFNPKRLQRIESYRGIYNRINALLTFPPPWISGYLDDLDDFFHSLRRDFPICCDIDQLRIFINLLAANRSYREFIVTIAMAKKDEYDRFQYLLFLIEFKYNIHFLYYFLFPKVLTIPILPPQIIITLFFNSFSHCSF
jgi:hypothetical protein